MYMVVVVVCYGMFKSVKSLAFQIEGRSMKGVELRKLSSEMGK